MKRRFLPFIGTLILSLVIGSNSEAQVFVPNFNSEAQYPTAAMTPFTYNLDGLHTNSLSNHSMPGNGPMAGKVLEVTGWSTPSDGGFSYGFSFTGLYTGLGAISISNATDVQVGFLENAGTGYVAAAYYDVSISHYCYNLYRWDLTLGTMTFLYKFKFARPEVYNVEFIPHTDYLPTYPGASPGAFYFPAPTINGTSMVYNRISMDVDRTGTKVAFVMTDGTDGKMFCSVGYIAPDTINLCPNLPDAPTYPFLSVGAPGPYVPINVLTVNFFTWTPLPGGAYETYDAASGQYVRWYPSGIYHYSYYPIDEWKYITEYDGTTSIQIASSHTNFSPLIGVKATSFVTTPAVNPYYQQYWPDVALSYYTPWSDDLLNIVFYLNNSGMQDLYTMQMQFSDLYAYTGHGGAWGTPSPSSYTYTGPTDLDYVALNTADGKALSSDYITGSGHGLYVTESRSVSLPSARPIRAKIDAPDNGNIWAITFAYTPSTTFFSPVTGYSDPDYPYTLIHRPLDLNLNNIYVRHSSRNQLIANNATMGYYLGGGVYTATNSTRNINPVLSWNSSGNKLALAWASEAAGAYSGTPWGYVGCKLDMTSYAFYTIPEYLYISTSPTLDCGTVPLIALSKHDHLLSEIYTSFTQTDASNVYSAMHKDNAWSSVGSWRTTSLASAESELKISVGPNPFTNSLSLRMPSYGEVILCDGTGKQLVQVFGETPQVNDKLNASIGNLVPGNYFLSVESGTSKKVFKLTKM